MNDSPGKPIKIALIDDNQDYLFTMGTFLGNNGFAVVTAADGAGGLGLIRQEEPDLVLLDVMMESSYAGFELWRAMQADPTLKQIPVIGVSAMQDELGVRPRGYPDQEYFRPAAFLDKPVDYALLLKTIAGVLKTAEEFKNRPGWKKALEKLTGTDPDPFPDSSPG